MKKIDLWDLVENEGKQVEDTDGEIATIVDVFAEDDFCILNYKKGGPMKIESKDIRRLLD